MWVSALLPCSGASRLGGCFPPIMATIAWRCQFVSHRHLIWDVYSDLQSMVPSTHPSCRRYGLLP